jgi:hypothetical protein
MSLESTLALGDGIHDSTKAKAVAGEVENFKELGRMMILFVRIGT